MTLFCAEALRPAACCVEDALVARGWEVALETGTAARPALAQLLQEPDAGLLVLCVPERVDASLAARMRARLDPEGRGDLHVVSIETPRSVIEAVEELGGTSRVRRVRRARRPRSVLAHPTLVEQQVGPGRMGWAAIGAAAALVVVALGLDLRTRNARSELPTTSEQPQAVVRETSTLVDDTVLSATVPSAFEDEEDERSRFEVRVSRPVFDPPPEQEAELADDDVVDYAMLEPAPLEDDELATSRPRAVGSVPGIRRTYTLDPFAGPLAVD